MSTSATAREARQQRRFEELTSTDAQLVAAQPDPAITAAIGGPGLLVADVIRTVMDGYADRPALGQRAVEFVTDANGRTVAALQPRFDTLTYRETWVRVRALAEALADNPVRPGERVATLGFSSADYAIVDMALSLTGAIAVPLQTNAPVQQLQRNRDRSGKRQRHVHDRVVGAGESERRHALAGPTGLSASASARGRTRTQVSRYVRVSK